MKEKYVGRPKSGINNFKFVYSLLYSIILASGLVGNIFVIDRKINIKTFSIAIAPFLAALLKFIFEGQPIFENFTIKEFTYLIIAAAIILSFNKLKLIIKFFKEYFKFKLAVIVYLFLEILIVITLFSIPNIYSYFLGISFFVSGLQRIVIQKTRALFFAQISEFMDFIKIYGYIRVAFFALGILGLLLGIEKIIGLNSPLCFVIFIFGILFSANLYPYYTKHGDIEKTIIILRKVAENKSIKVNKLISLVDASDAFIKQQLNRLVLTKYISIENKHVKLKDEYQKIYDSKW